MPNRHMKLVINVDDENVDVLTPLASSSVTDALGYTPMDSSDRGASNGVASLTSGKVPNSELPSYVDDVIEGYYYNNNFYSDSSHTQLITGEAGKIYVDLSANSSYRFTGSTYVEIDQSVIVDNAMNTSSTNPVQNRIITEAINNMRILILGTVNITASWASNGATVTCTKGAKTVTGTISAGVCTLHLPQGQWTITVTDQSTTGIEIIDVLFGYTYSVTILDAYHRMQRLVREGTIQNHYSIGDQITVARAGSNIVFDVVAFDVATPSDTTKTHSMTLVAHYLLPDSMVFDEREPDNPDSSFPGRKIYGNNRYKDSNIRLWLNSDGAAGSWWTAQHEYDAKPYYAYDAGFMNGFDANFLDVVGETTIKVVKPSVDGGSYEELVDKFYLPSTTEVGLGNENSIAEGTLFPYFSSSTQRVKSNGGGSALNWWLRTPGFASSVYVRFVDSSGTRSSEAASTMYGVAPACNII